MARELKNILERSMRETQTIATEQKDKLVRMFSLPDSCDFTSASAKKNEYLSSFKAKQF